MKLSHDGRGFDIKHDIISDSLIQRINDRKDELYPVRASTHKKQYAEAEACKKLFGIAVWWSQLTDDWDEVKEIHEVIYPEISKAYYGKLNFFHFNFKFKTYNGFDIP